MKKPRVWALMSHVSFLAPLGFNGRCTVYRLQAQPPAVTELPLPLQLPQPLHLRVYLWPRQLRQLLHGGLL